MKHAFVKIMEYVTEGDKKLMSELEKCILDTEGYYERHEETFEERGIEGDEEEEEIQWIAMVDILEREVYVAECDWAEELENFLYYVRELKKVKSLGLEVEDTWFEEEGEVTEWMEVLDDKWKKENIAMLAFDIDSDSYVFFPCNIAKIKQLEEWAKEEDFRIAYAKEM